MKDIYVAGPMRGLPNYNFPAFFNAEEMLSQEGWTVHNPARHDVETGTVALKNGEYHLTDDFRIEDVMRHDIAVVTRCDAIALLPGWEESQGAMLELSVARACGLDVFHLRDGELVHDSWVKADEPTVSEERRVTDPETGGQKGSKPERFDLIPAHALRQIARVYGKGAEKYDDNNWRRGYRWSLSYAAMQRHAWLFWQGEDLDPESGLPHMAHVGWHALTLLTFMSEHPDKDDRYV